MRLCSSKLSAVRALCSSPFAGQGLTPARTRKESDSRHSSHSARNLLFVCIAFGIIHPADGRQNQALIAKPSKFDAQALPKTQNGTVAVRGRQLLDTGYYYSSNGYYYSSNNPAFGSPVQVPLPAVNYGHPLPTSSINGGVCRHSGLPLVRANTGIIRRYGDFIPTFNCFSLFGPERLLIAQNIIEPHPDAIGGGNPFQGLGRLDDPLPSRTNTSSPAGAVVNTYGTSATTGTYNAGYPSTTLTSPEALGGTTPQNSIGTSPSASEAQARGLMYPSILSAQQARDASAQGGSASPTRLTQAYGDSGNPLTGTSGDTTGSGGYGLAQPGAAGYGTGLPPGPGDAYGLSQTGTPGDGSGLLPGLSGDANGLPPAGSSLPGSGFPSGTGFSGYPTSLPPSTDAGFSSSSGFPSSQNGLPGSGLPSTEGFGSTANGSGPGANADLARALQAISNDPEKSKSLLQLLQQHQQQQQSGALPGPGQGTGGTLVPQPPPSESLVPASTQPFAPPSSQLPSSTQTSASTPQLPALHRSKAPGGDSPLKDVLHLINTKQYDGAETNLRTHLTRYPNDMQAHYLLGVSLVFSKNYSEAKRAYQYVIDNSQDQVLVERARTGLRKLSR